MPVMRTTLGQLLVNEALPEDMRDYSRRIDKKTLKKILTDVAYKHPEKYDEISKKLLDVGADVSHREASSISLSDLKTSKVKTEMVGALKNKIQKILDDPRLTQDQKDKLVIDEVGPVLTNLMPAIQDEGLKAGNNLAIYAASGARGSASNVNNIVGAPLMFMDHKNRPIPVPIYNSFSEGLDPVEYYASAFGVRKGYIDIKIATPLSGFYGKELANAMHRLVITNNKPLPGTGLPADTEDDELEGSVLASDYGAYKSGTVITPKILKDLRESYKRILIHSPISSITTGGISQLAAGYREKGGFAPVGDNVGIAAAQAISEPIAQSMISSKHATGIVGSSDKVNAAAAKTFDIINNMSNIPKRFPGSATLSTAEGIVTNVVQAPQGGWYVHVGGKEHYVEPTQELKVKVGSVVEEGDMLCDGIPNPSEVVQYKGIGEGRRYFFDKMREIVKKAGGSHRRNIELMSRGLINHVRITDPEGLDGHMVDDIVDYDELATSYKPRPGTQMISANMARNKYLETPTLHYSIGTKITPSVINTLKEFKINSIPVNDKPPPFEPHMVRVMDALSVDKDWQTRLGGFGLQRALLDSVHSGGKSWEHGTSYIPALTKGVDFGKPPEGVLGY